MAEAVLRIFHYTPGQTNFIGSFQKADTLIAQRAFLADEHAMTYIDPLVAKKIRSLLSETTVSLPMFYLNSANLNWEGTNDNLQDIAIDYYKVISFRDKSPFSVFYHSILNKKIKTGYDSLIIEYAKSPINDDGFRSIPFRKKSPKKRILLIGDSFTFGYTTSNKVHSFYDLLLADGFEVYNTGLDDAGPHQYEAVANKYIPLLKPDIVLINFYMGNDVQYYRQSFAPFEPYNYQTNVGYLQVCPEGVHISNMREAYNLAIESAYIPVNKSSINHYCRKTAVTTLFWRLMKGKPGFDEQSDLLNNFYKKAKEKQLPMPDANTRIQAIRQLCDSNQCRLILSIIPGLSNDGARNLLYADSDSNLFKDIPYHEDRTLTESDFCKGSDKHFNENGHKKYAGFLKTLIGPSNR